MCAVAEKSFFSKPSIGLSVFVSMSLRIGYVETSITNKERLILSSKEQTNLIVLDNNNLNSTGISFNSNQTNVLRTANDIFYMDCAGQEVAAFGQDQSFVKGRLVLDSDLVVGGTFDSGSLNVSNINMVVQKPIIAGDSVSYIRIQQDNTNDIVHATLDNEGDSTLYVAGKVGIGTRAPAQALHVACNAVIGGDMRVVGDLQVPTITFSDAGSNYLIQLQSSNIIIQGASTIIRGDALIENDLRVQGNTYIDIPTTDRIVAEDNVTTGAIFVTNLLPTRDSINVLHNTFSTKCNVMNVDIKLDALSLNNFNAFTIDHRGRVGVGSATPNGVLHVEGDLNFETCNVLYLKGRTSNADMVYNAAGRLGIGTKAPTCTVHIHGDSNDVLTSGPFVGITNGSPTLERPFITAYSNQQSAVFNVSHKGAVTIGNISANDSWSLSVASNMRVPLIETSSIVGAAAPSKVIQMNMSSLCNVMDLHASNVRASNMYSKSNVTDFLYALDYYIPEFSVINTKQYFEVRLSKSVFQASKMYVGDDPGIGERPLTDFDEGRLIVLPISTGAATPIGLHVKGITPNAAAKVTAVDNPQLLFGRSSTGKTATIEYSRFAGGLRFTSDDITSVTNPLLLSANGIEFMNDSIRVDTTGRLIIGSGAPNNIDGRMYIRDDVRFDDRYNRQRIRYVAETGRFGVGTINPDAALHVADRSIFTCNVLINESTLEVTGTRGCVGIRTSANVNYSLNILGNVNFDGTLTQNGNVYAGSQWTTNQSGNQTNVFIQGSNVGIGTNNPNNYGLYVNSSSFFNSNVTFRGVVTTQNGIASVSDRALKNNLQPITESIDMIQRLNGYIYDRIDTGRRECGLIAQEVQDVVPELVYAPSSSSEFLSLAYGNMAALFVEAIKDLNNRLAEVEKHIKRFNTSV